MKSINTLLIALILNMSIWFFFILFQFKYSLLAYFLIFMSTSFNLYLITIIEKYNKKVYQILEELYKK